MRTSIELRPIAPAAIAAGIVDVRGLQLNETKKVVFLIVDPDTMNDDFIAKEAKDYWILYKYTSKNETINEPILQTTEIPKIIS